jgi:hypothetical protein
LGLKCVNGRKPNDGSPSKIESEVIVTNVDSAKIPIFVDEEIHHVDGVEEGRDQHGFGDVTVDLILIRNEGGITGFTLGYIKENHNYREL